MTLSFPKIGAVVGAVFGTIWFYYAAFLTFPQYRSIDGTVSIALGAAFGIAAVARLPRVSPSEFTADSRSRRSGRMFAIVMIAEIVLINVAWNVLLATHRAEYLVAAVASIIGLHFVALARIFNRHVFYIPAIVMTAAGILAALTLWNAVACLCCAFALWTAVSVRPRAVPQ